jgi:gamma-glutamylcyclotransferase (GGCT)/AIG2-like uncharacterized protein YtfP
MGKSGARGRGMAVAALAAALVLVWFGYSFLNNPADDPLPGYRIEDGSHRLFVYGTLRSDLVRWLVIGRQVDSRQAWLPGFQRRGLTIETREGARTPGEVIEVDAVELRRVDRYERLGTRYERICERLESGERAFVYRRLISGRATVPEPGASCE